MEEAAEDVSTELDPPLDVHTQREADYICP